MSAFAGTYADLKFVKSRRVAQVVIEMPIEDANRFLQAFGAPNPAEEIWLAIAGLNHAPETHDSEQFEKPPRHWEELRPSARCAMFCKSPAFWVWLGVTSENEAIEKVKKHCGIRSRRELDFDETKLMMFRTIESKFQETWVKDR